MPMIELNKIASERSRQRFDEEEGEDLPAEPAVVTTKTTIATDAIRCFYPRRGGQPGTRITFRDGGGFAVSESYDEVRQMLTPN